MKNTTVKDKLEGLAFLQLHDEKTNEPMGVVAVKREDEEDVKYNWKLFNSTNSFGEGVNNFVEYLSSEYGDQFDVEIVEIFFYSPDGSYGHSQ